MKYSNNIALYPLSHIDRDDVREKFPEEIPCHIGANNPFVDPSVKLSDLYTPEEFLPIEDKIGFTPYPLFCVIIDYLYSIGFHRIAETPNYRWDFERDDIKVCLHLRPDLKPEWENWNFYVRILHEPTGKNDWYTPEEFFLKAPFDKEGRLI